MTLSIPNNETPLKIKGATEAGKSMPCAKPHAATAPPYFILAQTFARVWLPTESTAAAHCSFIKGLPGADNSALSIISVAPKLVK